MSYIEVDNIIFKIDNFKPKLIVFNGEIYVCKKDEFRTKVWNDFIELITAIITNNYSICY
jgi:hypothetical protein